MTSLGERISVCLLTYNHAGVVASTLESVLAQNIDGFDVLISDDCSNDGTWDAVVEIASRYPHVRAVQTPRNMGMAANANHAVAQCSRPFIALLHHDDIYRHDLLEKWGQVMANHDDVAFVFNPYGHHPSGHVSRYDVPSERVSGMWLLQQHLWPRWGCIVRGTAMIRKEAWDEVGGMREKFGMLSDVDLWMRFCRSWAVGYVDEPIISVRRAQPSYYPEAYRDANWTWKRQRILYDIHATNRLEVLDRNTLAGRLAWHRFRLRLGVESTKWLTYGVLRRRPEIVRTSRDGETPHDLVPVRALRWALSTGVNLLDKRTA